MPLRPSSALVISAALLAGACASPAPTPGANNAPAAPATPSAPAAPAAPTAPAASPATPAGAVTVVNAGFESPVRGARGDPEGWFAFQHAGNASYRYVLDSDSPHAGAVSLRIDNIGPEPYGAIAQVFVAPQYVGKTARLTGWLRTKDAVDGGAGLTLLALQSGNTVAYNFMYDAPARGTTGWTRYTITMPVPKGTDRLEIGAMLRGRGSLWFDDAVLEFVTP